MRMLDARLFDVFEHVRSLDDGIFTNFYVFEPIVVNEQIIAGFQTLTEQQLQANRELRELIMLKNKQVDTEEKHDKPHASLQTVCYNCGISSFQMKLLAQNIVHRAMIFLFDFHRL